jgi:hypothetical protein
MDVSKCIFCEHHDVNAKTTFCKLNNESTCTNNDIPCPLELEVESNKKNILRKEQLEKYARYLKANCKDCEGCQFEVVDGEETHCRINGLLPCDWEV